MTASYDHIKSRFVVRAYADDPADATVVRKIAWVPMGRDFLALATMVVRTANILTFKIFCADNADGTGNVTEVKAHADPTVADAAGDQVHLEVSAEEVHAKSATARYVSAEIDCANAADVCAVTYVMDGALAGGRFAYEGLTADVIA